MTDYKAFIRIIRSLKQITGNKEKTVLFILLYFDSYSTFAPSLIRGKSYEKGYNIFLSDDVDDVVLA